MILYLFIILWPGFRQNFVRMMYNWYNWRHLHLWQIVISYILYTLITALAVEMMCMLYCNLKCDHPVIMAYKELTSLMTSICLIMSLLYTKRMSWLSIDFHFNHCYVLMIHLSYNSKHMYTHTLVCFIMKHIFLPPPPPPPHNVGHNVPMGFKDTHLFPFQNQN